MKARGEDLVRSIEELRLNNGQYPDKLPESVSGEATRIWHRWHYSTTGSDFNLSFGDYAKDGFYLAWDTRKKQWIEDL